jgi:hypothetical protein
MPKKRLKLVAYASGPAHCAVCGERFMGEDRAEVSFKGDKRSSSVIVHATCFDPKTMEVA